AGVNCGDACHARFGAGTVVSLTATTGGSSVFRGWSGDCSGTGACRVTMDQAHSVAATFGVNKPPSASFTFSCTGLSCSFDASSSSDSDGAIASYAWSFGDGTGGTGTSASHSYTRAASHTVALTVTDDVGATATASQTVSPISLCVAGAKLN